jgi:hypothetical protein
MIPVELFVNLAVASYLLQEVSLLLAPACALVANTHRLATPAVLPVADTWLRTAVACFHEKTVVCRGTEACGRVVVACIVEAVFFPHAAAASLPVVDVSHHAAAACPPVAAAGSPDLRCAFDWPTRSFFPPHELVWGRWSPIHPQKSMMSSLSAVEISLCSILAIVVALTIRHVPRSLCLSSSPRLLHRLIRIHLHKPHGVLRLLLHPRGNVLIRGDVVVLPRSRDLCQCIVIAEWRKEVDEPNDVGIASGIVFEALDEALCEAQCE